MKFFDKLYSVKREIRRDIQANNTIYNSKFNYANNFIKTSKYSILTFLPLNLFEQFQKLANFYFLCLLILQVIPVISSLTPITTALPLLGVLSLIAVKDAYDDIQRHRTDRHVNYRKSYVLRKGFVVEEKWHRVQVGDVIRMENNQFIAADILILSTNNPNGICFIETSELDGETNLKTRQCLMETNALGQNVVALSDFDGRIVCEPPNNNLSRFEGVLEYQNHTFPLDNDNILLRGTVLRNTEWCYGIVIFAGKDTKLMQNSGKTMFKRTSIDHLLDFIIVGIVFFLACMCLFCMISCGVWETLTGNQFQIYLPWDLLVPEEATAGATVIALLIFLSYAIVLNTVVPISLYVSVEVIRFTMSFFINWDLGMYYVKGNTPAKARTTTLNEELGQIEYIFTDKTGTLTQNLMTFNKCSIRGRIYGDLEPSNNDSQLQANNVVDFSDNPWYEPTFNFYDKSLLRDVQRENYYVQEFFRLLSVCHTVMPEIKNGILEYQAQSPDENALVSAARNFGFVFIERTINSVTVSVAGVEEIFDMLCILDFSNERKRMSVILRGPDNSIKLYCKGADSVILERLKSGQEGLIEETKKHLNKFATEGLRTLMLATRDITEAEFEDWKVCHQEAALSLVNRDALLDNVYDLIEKDLILIGVTAIEDKLQNGVPQTIENLKLAGIKIWVLTGDKQETAINIGYCSQLLSENIDDEEPFIVDGVTADEVCEQLTRHLTKMYSYDDTTTLEGNELMSSDLHSVFKPSSTHHLIQVGGNDDHQIKNDMSGPSFSLVIDGHALIHALSAQMEILFLSVADKCGAIICCRVTPLQKSLVVELVKKYKKAVTLAVGDGANDVSMIKTAHIGVGISGQEGMQAVLASDYSIAQFQYLERLILVHGRWSYYRMCKFLRYFFYKNFAFTLCHFWFAFFCGFSAQATFATEFIAGFNLFYTSLPVLAMGCLDQDVGSLYAMKYAKLYIPGLKSELFNLNTFIRTALHGVLTSCILVFIIGGAYHDRSMPNGQILNDHMLIGSVVATNLILVVTAQVALDTSYWTFLNHLCIWASVFSYFSLHFIFNFGFGSPYIGSLTMAMVDLTFWFTLLIVLVILLLPVVAWRFFLTDVQPTLMDKVRLLQLHSKLKPKRPGPRVFSDHRTRRSIRSGYAFSHQEGFGRLITSGKIMSQNSGTASPCSDTIASCSIDDGFLHPNVKVGAQSRGSVSHMRSRLTSISSFSPLALVSRNSISGSTDQKQTTHVSPSRLINVNINGKNIEIRK